MPTVPNKENSIFMLDVKSCEAAYLVLLGISNSPHASKAPGQWIRAKKFFAEGKDISGIRYRWNECEKEELLKAEHKQTKSDSAKTIHPILFKRSLVILFLAQRVLCIVL